MDISKTIIGFLVALGISAALVPLVKKIGFKYQIYAQENNRTVHHGKIVRIGGVALFISLVIVEHFVLGLDNEFTSITIGAALVFLGGLIDDIYDLKPIVKFLIQVVAASLVIIVSQKGINIIKFGSFTLELGVLSKIIAIFWIVGVTNALNLLDGLDGLCLGCSSIMLVSMAIVAIFMGEFNLATFEIIMIGSLIGVLFYNFHPASIFIGDCGSQCIGFLIACFGIQGYKSTALITLTVPMIVLFIPIADTLSAMIRRKLKHESISQADKSHLHHIIMYKLGFTHRQTVLIIYGFVALFAFDAVLIFLNRSAGTILFIILAIMSYLFVELTGIISPTYHPVIGACRRIFKHPVKSDSAYFEANKINHKNL